MNKSEEIKLNLCNFLKNNKGKHFSLKDLSRKTHVSYPAVLKWIEVLIRDYDKIKTKDFGNVRVVWWEKDR